MKRIRKENPKESVQEFKSHFLNTRGKVIGVCVIAVILLLLTVLLMVVESRYGKLIVKNKTDYNLDYVKTAFINSEDTVDEGVQTESIAAHKTSVMKLEKANILYSEANLEVRFKLENSEEMFTAVGYFMDNFNGNITISFTKTDDPNLIKLKIKASNGIFQTKTVECDEEFTINLSEGKILE